MNFETVLNQGMSVGMLVAFASGNPLVIVGAAAVTGLVDILEDAFGPDPNATLVTAMTDLGSAITTHMNDLTDTVLAAIDHQALQNDMNVLCGMATEFQDDQQNLSNALQETGANALADFRTEVQNLQQKVDASLSGSSALSSMLADCLNCADLTHAYATLPLTMASTLFYANYLKYASTMQVALAAKTALAAVPPLTGGLGVIPVVNDLNSDCYRCLYNAITSTLPLVQALNQDVSDRRNAANGAAAPEVASPYGGIINSANGQELPAMGSVNLGYGRLSGNARSRVLLVANATAYQTSWLTSTSTKGMHLLSENDILLLNYNLATMYQAAQICYQTLPINTQSPYPLLPSLTTIYPPPPGYQPNTQLAGALAKVKPAKAKAKAKAAAPAPAAPRPSKARPAAKKKAAPQGKSARKETPARKEAKRPKK